MERCKWSSTDSFIQQVIECKGVPAAQKQNMEKTDPALCLERQPREGAQVLGTVTAVNY
jgi:hypothetical protein